MASVRVLAASARANETSPYAGLCDRDTHGAFAIALRLGLLVLTDPDLANRSILLSLPFDPERLACSR